MDLCGGMMTPIRIERKGGPYIILHRCQNCGFERRNKMSEYDNFEAVLEISENQ